MHVTRIWPSLADVLSTSTFSLRIESNINGIQTKWQKIQRLAIADGCDSYSARISFLTRQRLCACIDSLLISLLPILLNVEQYSWICVDWKEKRRERQRKNNHKSYNVQKIRRRFNIEMFMVGKMKKKKTCSRKACIPFCIEGTQYTSTIFTLTQSQQHNSNRNTNKQPRQHIFYMNNTYGWSNACES